MCTIQTQILNKCLLFWSAADSVNLMVCLAFGMARLMEGCWAYLSESLSVPVMADMNMKEMT